MTTDLIVRVNVRAKTMLQQDSAKGSVRAGTRRGYNVI